MLKKIPVLIFALAGFLNLPSFAHAVESQRILSFKDLKEVDIIVEEIEPGLGFTKEDIKKFISAKLRKELPSLKIKKNISDYLYIRIVALDVQKNQIAGNISIMVKRRLLLPDKEKFVTAGVRNYGNIFYVGKDNSSEYVKNILNALLDKFANEYRNARKVYSGGGNKGSVSEKSKRYKQKKKGGNEKKVWSNQ